MANNDLCPKCGAITWTNTVLTAKPFKHYQACACGWKSEAI